MARSVKDGHLCLGFRNLAFLPDTRVLNLHPLLLHCLVLDGVYRRTDGEPVFVEVPAPTDEDLQALLHKIITRLMKLLTRRGVLVEEEGEGSSYRVPPVNLLEFRFL